MTDDGDAADVRRSRSPGFPNGRSPPVRAGPAPSRALQPVVGTLSTIRTSTLSGVETTGGAAMARIAIVVATKQSAEAPADRRPMKITHGRCQAAPAR